MQSRVDWSVAGGQDRVIDIKVVDGDEGLAVPSNGGGVDGRLVVVEVLHCLVVVGRHVIHCEIFQKNEKVCASGVCVYSDALVGCFELAGASRWRCESVFLRFYD